MTSFRTIFCLVGSKGILLLVMQITVSLFIAAISAAYAATHPSVYVLEVSNQAFVSVSIANSTIASISRLITGAFLSIFVSIILSSMIFFYKVIPWQLAVRCFLLVSITPPLIWSVASILISGLSWWGPVIVVFLSTVFLLSGLITNLFNQLPDYLQEIIEQYQPSKVKQLTLFLLREQQSTLLLFARVSLFFSWIPLLSAEAYGTQSGLGNILTLGRSLHSWPIVIGVWGTMLSAALFIDFVFQLLVRTAANRVHQYE